MENLKQFESALESKLAEQKAEVAAVTEKAAKQFDSKVELCASTHVDIIAEQPDVGTIS